MGVSLIAFFPQRTLRKVKFAKELKLSALCASLRSLREKN